MNRIKRLGRYPKAILLMMAAMVLTFSVIYPLTVTRDGFAYMDTILVPHQENDKTIYSGKIQGKQADFTVNADKSVMFRYGDQTYGPYVAKEAPEVVPKDSVLGSGATGVELRRGEEIIFRGALLKLNDILYIYKEDGSLKQINTQAIISKDPATDENGKANDPMEPFVATILDLIAGPELTHRGESLAWFGGVLLCIVTALLIIFADELFRLDLIFRIRHAERAQPSSWEIAGRYILWTALPVIAMVVFIMGLK